ncbi:MAG: hypothetical protein H6644_11520 [Caldilineaceae bacterium]|nr:hypothetical protein [Caldilineaceae bacterium]
MTNLRQVLDERNNDPPCLLITRSTLQFNRRSDSVLDVDWLTAFEEAPTTHRDRQWTPACLFLDGFTIYACPDFEHWLLHTRTWSQNTVRNALALLANHAEAQGDLSMARPRDRQLLPEPWHEPAPSAIKCVCSGAPGHRTAALRQHEQCVHALPTSWTSFRPATDALVAQIRTCACNFLLTLRHQRPPPAR